jgi:hypothetical protein
VDAPTVRRIRIHPPHESTYVIDTWRGRITGVTGEHRELLGRNETDVATELRAAGCTFVDITEPGGIVGDTSPATDRS